MTSPSSEPSSFIWSGTASLQSGSASASWFNPGNWVVSGGSTNAYGIPGSSAPDAVTFGTAIGSSTATITLDGNWTIGALTFCTTGGGSYLIALAPGDTTSTLTLAGTGTSFPLSNNGSNPHHRRAARAAEQHQRQAPPPAAV